ncbi:MAG: transglycosylase domain-containing protein [Oscillospiraceae bacterium]|nr:transglycosylase domain-containing protein [Oscillospiraceae bacterium]
MKTKVIKRILIVLGAIMAVMVIIAGYFAVSGAVWWRSAMGRAPLEQTVAEMGSRENFIKYSELPEFYIKAVISTEDRKFESHNGVNIKSIIRAMIYDVRSLSFEQGGSTITQQVAKNLWFTQEKRIERKFAEVYAAFALEKSLSKQEIFELYVNSIYFGSGYYGIADAARGYFGKDVSELSDYECAMLAGLPNAPSAYSPDASPELARRRLALVLNSMKDNGVLTADQAEKVMAAA